MNNFLLCKGRMAIWYPLLTGCCFLFCSIPCFSRDHCRTFPRIYIQQEQTISGTLTDTAGTLPGVIVRIKGKNATAVSDAKGRYSIVASPGDVLIFESIGYKTTEVSVGSQTVIDLMMEENATTLEGVEINAGYYTVREKESTGNIARITSKDIEKQPVTNVLAAMQGRMAGVSITQTTGAPGGGFDIQIRGQNSLRSDGNSPLYIIDGMPYSSESVGNSRSTVVLPFSANPLNTINPSDIASIEVLKDADATAIYGSRGANGVVLITTKKGREGKDRYNFDVRQGIGQVTGYMDLLNTQQYLEMRREAFANDGIEVGPSDYDVNGTWDPNRYTDWQKKLFGGTASYTDMQASVSGGSATTQFLASAALHNETTVFPGDFNYRKATVRLNLSHQSEDGKFGITATAGYTAQKNKLPGIDLTRFAPLLAPNAPALYDSQGNLNWEGSTWQNPLGNLEGKYTTTTDDLIANGILTYAVATGLAAKVNLGFTDTRHFETRTQPSTMYDPAYGLGSEYSVLTQNITSRRSWLVEPQLEYKKEFGPIAASAIAGATFQHLAGNQLVEEATGFVSNALIYNLSSASSLMAIADTETIYKYQAFFGRINLNYNSRYIINLTARRDGSSRFGPGNQFANFGAVGAAWLFSNEAWAKKGEGLLSYGKLRGSYGSTGSDQLGDYQFLNTYSSTGVHYGGVIGIAPNRLYNPDFGWETNKKLEAALELGFNKDRIFMTAAWYQNRSSNQLVGIPLPFTTGFSSIQSNLNATVQNTGIEFSLRTVNLQDGPLKWTTSLNITRAKNKLVSFPGLEGSTYRNLYEIGKPLNIIKAYHYTGIDPQTGIYQFEDKNGDGIITAAEDRTSIVDLNPDFYGGLQNQLTYKNWQLDFLLQFVKQENYSEEYSLGLPGSMSNQTTRILNRWQQPGDARNFQRFSTGVDGQVLDASDKYFNSDAMITDASFIRLKSVALSFTVPKEWIKGTTCVLSLEGQNLLTFTPYKGNDPEFRFAGYLPPLRVITTAIKLIF